MNLSRLPFIGRYYDKLKNRLLELNTQLNNLADENIRLRFKLKAQNKEKIKVVFLCWRPSVWGSLKTVYEAMKKDKAFDVTILAIPNKKQLPKLGYNHEVYESEGAEEFWTGKDVIKGYNYETKEWFDLKSLKPDYVCYQQPYDLRTASQKARVVSKYARLFYVHYASNFIGSGVLEESSPSYFVNEVSLWFNQNQMDFDLMKSYFSKIGNTRTKQFLTGFPRSDNLEQYKNAESGLWSFSKSKKHFRVIWTPRWCTDEGNCNFFEYKDLLVDYCQDHIDIDFIFRPHPHAFDNWLATGELPQKAADAYKQRYAELPNANIDTTAEYFATFFSSDCLITDVSSIVADYFMTGKPVIYCHKIDCFNDFSRKLSEGFYWVKNWDELKTTLEMLKSGKDPLKEKRQLLLDELFFRPKQGSGKLIKDIIKKDFFDA